MSNKHKALAVILAGGQGTRFWPVSRRLSPKQFLSISESGESLIAATGRRISPLVGEENVCIVTNADHEKQVREHVPYAQIITEPIARNTAAPIGLAAITAQARGEDPVLIVLPADHAVANEEAQRRTLAVGIDLAAEEEALVTVGIPPTYAHTGYGYIQRGESVRERCSKVRHFFEKPNLERAQEYLASPDFFWNSGMFLWRASVFLNALETHMPALRAELEGMREALGSPEEEQVKLAAFERLESISIDFGVLEHAKNCLLVEAFEYGWNDVGSWDAWADHFASDDAGNVTSGGEAMFIDSKDSVVVSQKPMTALVGLENVIVIETEDALLVCDRARAQDVKKVAEELKKRGRSDLL